MIHLLANVTPAEQEAAIKHAKSSFPEVEMEVDQLADAEIALFEISDKWGKTREWVRRYLAATFMVLLSVVNLFDDAGTERMFRVRVKTGQRVERVA